MILGGALAPTLAPPGSEWGMNDLDFLQGMYDAGAAPYFDGLAVHSYGWTFAPTNRRARCRQLQARGAAAGDHGAKRRREQAIVITEVDGTTTRVGPKPYARHSVWPTPCGPMTRF